MMQHVAHRPSDEIAQLRAENEQLKFELKAAKNEIEIADGEIGRQKRLRDGWHENFKVLCHALVGETGLSAIEEAHKLRAMHPLSGD